MKKWNRHFLFGATALSLTIAGIGTAFSAPPSDQVEWGCGYGFGHGKGRNWDSGKMQERMKARISQRHAALHDKLNLNPEQEAAWQKYTAATMANLASPKWDPSEMSKLTAPERMEKMLQRMKERENVMAAQLDALKTFYAVLTPEQQKIFDAESGMGRARFHRNSK